jgi:preprotein translocase subunit SecE
LPLLPQAYAASGNEIAAAERKRSIMADSKIEKAPGFVAKLGKYLRDTRGEMKKVVWPSRKQTINNTMIVLVFMLVVAIVIGLFDAGLGALIRLAFGAGS